MTTDQTPNKEKQDVSQSSIETFFSNRRSISSQNNRNIPKDPYLFRPADISHRAEDYNIVDPCPNASDIVLQEQSPCLLAFRNKAITIRPEVHQSCSPSSKQLQQQQQLQQQTTQQTQQSSAQQQYQQQRARTSQASRVTTRSSILVRRPLSDLKDPVVYALEIGKRQIEEEKQTISFTEDPIAYFSKRKDGRGHRFIYLVYKGNPKDVLFSPYELEKVPSAQIGENFFTMSATGVTHSYPDGTTESMTLDHWALEKSTFEACRKLKTFIQFYYWKPFRIWKNFVMQQRYNELERKVTYHPFFRCRSFFKQTLKFNQLQLKSYEMLRTLLLAFHSQRKYRLDEFEETSQTNIEKLKNDYANFIQMTMEKIRALYFRISDPHLVQVQDSDFPQIKRRNPNIGQLMVLEKSKASKRVDNTILVNKEIEEIGGYIRMIDYMLLETLVDGCVKCWRIADNNVSQPEANVFQVEVLFDDDGKVAFKPSHDDLMQSISKTLDDSLETLNKLPRVLVQSPLRPFLRDNGLNMENLLENGPTFDQIMSCSAILKTIKEHILQVVSDSYKEAFLFSQTFADFYPIFKLGKTWRVRDYVFTRSGKKFEGPIAYDQLDNESPDDFLAHSSEQPVVDFVKVAHDIEQYRSDVKRVDGLRSGAIRGAIYIDSRGLKTALIPIPQRSLLELQDLLTNLATRKITQLNNAMKFYCQKLKIIPQALEDYVSFCATLTQTIRVMPEIEDDIEFIDKMFKMFDDFGFVHNQNSVHASFSVFKTDQSIAQATRDDYLDVFTEALKSSLFEIESKINKFFEKATNIPSCIKDADVDTRFPAAKKLCAKIEGIRSRVQTVCYQQTVMGVDINDFASFNNLVFAGEFAVKLYEAVGQWLVLANMMTQVPFSKIDMGKFRKDIDSLNDAAIGLQSSQSSSNYPVLSELITKISDTVPYVEQLELLANGKMQNRHWNMLFESCDRQNAYHNDITIEELMNLGILRAKEQIAEITATSQGESELESEFLAITNHWNRIQLPLADSPAKMNEDTLLLGPTEPLLKEIQETLVQLNKILLLPYVQGIRDSVSNLTSTLENLSQIIEAWQLFQSNWVILLSLFSMEEAKSILPHQTNRFAGVQRKWTAIARYTLKDPRLFQVCAYPALLEVLNENNSSMESILASLGKYIDAKRFSSTRLCFLSNKEVLTIATTTNFSLFTRTLSKILMRIERIDCHENDGGEGEAAFTSNNIQQLRLYGLVGEDGNMIQFEHYILCKSQMEVWINQLIEAMHTTVKNELSNSLKVLTKTKNFADWVTITPSYYILISLHAMFTADVDECLAKFVKDQHSLNDYELILISKIKELKSKISLLRSPPIEYKFSCIIALLIKFRDQVHSLSEFRSHHSLTIEWSHILKIRFEQQKSQFFVEYLNETVEHGYEYWGKIPNLIYSPSINDAVSALAFCWSKQEIPLLNSTVSSGKQTILRSCACLCGHFSYVARAFPDFSEFVMARLLIGTISCGAWTIFTNIDKLQNNRLCYLFDIVRNWLSAKGANCPRITIATHPVEINLNSRIFLTANTNYQNSTNIPPQLKSFVRPIALVAPPIRKLLEVRLASIGFSKHVMLADQLGSFIESITTALDQVLSNPSVINHAIAISDQAIKYIHKDKDLSQSFALAFCSFERFVSICDKTRKTLLVQILFSSFKFGQSYEDLVNKIDDFRNGIISDTIQNAIKIEMSKMALDLPNVYLCEQVMQLFSLMKKYSCVIIVGPPNSGKTIALDTLMRIFDREDVLKEVPNSKPFQFAPLFPQSDTWIRMFGNSYEDLSIGPMFSCGQFHSALYHLMNSPNKHQILKLDGKLTKNLGQFLSQLFGPPNHRQLMINTMDTFEDDRKLHVIVETSNINNVSQLLLPKCGVLYMHNIQIASPITPALPVCRLVFPNIPYARALKACSEVVDPSHVPLIRSTFDDIAPKIVKHIYHTPNIVCFSEYAKRLESGSIILSDIITCYSGIISMNLIFSTGSDPTNDEQVKEVIILSFFRVCAGILEPKELPEFDKWLRQEFKIKVPENWVGFNVSDAFWDCYNNPSIQSMRHFNGKFVPLNFKLLEEPPIYIPRSENQLPYIIEDVKVYHAQILPQLRLCEVLLSANQNILIHGPFDSGKTSFIQILFKGKDTLVPLLINVSDQLNTETIISYIALNTPLLSKTVPPNIGNKKYVLVFDGLRPEHTEVIEFIRMIVTNRTIPLNSVNDEKVFEFIKMHKFNVVVTSRNYKKLPSRFLVNFCPVQLHKITDITATFIAKKILKAYGYEDYIAESVLRLGLMVLNQYPHGAMMHDILQMCSTLCFIEYKTDNYTRLASLLADLHYTTLHRFAKEEIADKITFIFKGECQTDEEKKLVYDFLTQDTIFNPTFTLSRDYKTFTALIEEHPMMSLLDDLRDQQIVYNMNAIEKIVLRFTPQIANEWALLFRSLSCPGHNVILEGRTGSGRYTMTRFVTNMCEADFVFIAEPTVEEMLSFEDRKSVIFGILRDVISNATVQQKKSVIFMRATKKNEREARILADFIANNDFLSVYTNGSVEELFSRFASLHNPSFEQRNSAIRQIQNLIKLNIHVVISLSSDSGYDLKYNGFNRVVFNTDTPIARLEVACDGVDSIATKKVAGPIAPQLVKLLPEFAEIAKKYTPCVHPNDYYDFIDSFSHFSAADFQDISTKNENITSALQFVSQLENESHAIDKRLDALAPTLQRIQADSETLQTSYTTRKESIVSRRAKLEKDQKIKTEEIQEIKAEFDYLESTREELIPLVEKYQTAVESLTHNDIETVRITAVDPSAALRLLLDVFCLFLDLPPSFERGGQKLLMDPQFVKTIVTRINQTVITNLLLDNVQPYFDSPELNPTDLETSAPALKTLYDWIRSLCDLTRLNNKYKDQKTIYEEKQRSLDEYNNQMSIELGSIEQVEQSLECENKALLQSAISKEQMEKEYAQVDTRKKSIDLIFKGIDQFTDQWNTESREFTTKRNKIIGNSIIFSFYLVYCGAMTLENREKSLNQVLEMLKQAGVETSYVKPLEEIKDQFIIASPSDHIGKFAQAALDAHHAMTTIRTPLIIDPDGIVTGYISGGIKMKKLAIVSQNCSSLDTIAASAISDGKTLFVTDVDSLNPIIASILALDLFTLEPKMSCEIRVGTKLVTWDQKFKLYLTSNVSSVDMLPDALLSRVTVIDVTSSSLLSTQESICKVFVEFFDPDLAVKMNEMYTKELEYKVAKIQHEHETLDFLADIVATQMANSKYDYLMDKETINGLIKAKDSYLNIINNPLDYSQLIEEYNNMINPFKPHIMLCHEFWKVMSRDLAKINTTAKFVFHNYQKFINSVFSNDGLHAGTLSVDQHSALRNSLISTTFQFVANTIPYTDTLFFMFMSGYSIRSHNNKIDEKDLNKVLMHIKEEVKGSHCDFSNNESRTGETFDHLKYTNVVNIFHYISRFIVEHFGPDYSTYLPHFQADSIVTNSASLPTIVITPTSCDPTSYVLRFISQRCRHENLDVISLTNDLELIRNSKKVITTAINRGNWVLIYYSSPSPAIASMLCDIFTQLTTTSVNTNFRLIMIASTTKYLASSMLSKCKRIAIDEFPSIRSLMLEMLHHNGTAIKSSLNSKAMKQLSYATSLLISLMYFRHFVRPFGFSTIVRPNEMAISDSIELLRVIIDQSPTYIPISNYKESVRKIAFAGIPEERDREIINCHISQILSKETLKDDFTIAPATSKDKDRWSIPPDGPVSNFTQIAQLLPVFATPEILDISAHLLRNWTMATWITRPFIKYIAAKNQTTGKKVKKGLDYEFAARKIENLLVMLPQKIGTGDPEKFKTVIGIFLLSEVERLNSIIISLRDELSSYQHEFVLKKKNPSKNALKIVSHNRTPREWRIMTNFWISKDLDIFIHFITETYKQLTTFMKKNSLSTFDIRYFLNPKLLLESFLLNYAVEDKVSISALKYEFSTAESTLFELSQMQQKEQPRTLTLKGIHIGAAKVNKGCNDVGNLVVINKEPKSNPFQQVDELIGKVVPSKSDSDTGTPPAKMAKIPLYQQAFVDMMGAEDSAFNVENGKSNNLIWNVELPSKESESNLLKAGVALFCRIPDQIL